MKIEAVTPIGKRVNRVLCDGTPVVNCVEVDPEAGVAVYVIRTPIGEIRQLRRGTITIEWRGGFPPAEYLAAKETLP